VQDRPDASELLAALRMFLTEEVAPVVPDELRFSMRVAINVCGMLEREAALGERDVRAEAAALAELFGEEPPEGEPRPAARELQRRLAGAIRAGELDERLAEVVPVLREQLAARLRVAHPGWESFSDDGHV
jgi:hypothetical protein